MQSFIHRKDPIDCEDLCHLKWLIIDHRNLLKFVQSGRCSNGLALDYLGYNLFKDCPLVKLS